MKARPLRIDLILPSQVRGSASGSWTSLAALICAWQAAGHHITVLDAPEGQGPQTALPPTWADGWRQQPPDLVHCEIAGPLSLAALRQARAAGLRVSSAFHHIFLHAPPGKAAEVLGFLLRFHQACDLSICETRRSQRLASTLAIGNTLAICRGVDSERFHPRQRDEALRRSWGAGPDDPVLLWAGRLIPAKDPLALAAIWPALLARAPRARLVIAGDGPESPRLRAALPAAILLGRVDGPALAAVFASADLLLHTAPDEPLGNVQLEAAASGLAVVGRSGGALEELLAPAGAGIRTDDLAGAAGDLAADPARRRSMGLAARQAAGRVGIDAGAAAWIAAWRRLLTTPPAGTRV